MASIFPKEGLAFLRSLSRNNRREWFQVRKKDYETRVKEPFVEIVEDLNRELHKFASHHVNDPAKAIYRIYRDTRFSSDKTPYKTHVSAIFPRRGFQKHVSAGYYFEISPKGIGVACGCYMPGPDELRTIRAWLADHHLAFRKSLKAAEKVLGPLQGEALQRVPKGFDPDHPAAALIKQKQWYFWLELDAKLAHSPKLVTEISRRFRAAAPFVELLNTPLVAQQKRAPLLDLGGIRAGQQRKRSAVASSGGRDTE